MHMAPKQAMQCLLYFIISRGWWWNICKLNFTFRSTRESQHLKDSHGNYPLTAKNYFGGVDALSVFGFELLDSKEFPLIGANFYYFTGSGMFSLFETRSYSLC